MEFYTEITSYDRLLNVAARDTEHFSESECNAIRGALRMLVCQDNKVYPWQKQVGNHRGDLKFELRGYVVYLGYDHSREKMYLDVEPSPGNWINGYHICGIRPVREIYEPGRITSVIFKYDWNTGDFVNGEDYRDKVYHSHSDVEEVGEEIFLYEVRKLREKLDTENEWKTEALPPPRVMDGVNRICRINWKQDYVENLTQIKLFHEFQKRLKQCVSKLKWNTFEELFDELEIGSDEFRNRWDYCRKVLSEINNPTNQRVCLWYLQWIFLSEQKWKQEQAGKCVPNPFEPLIYMMERGVNFEQPEAKLLHYYEQLLLNKVFLELQGGQEITELDYELLETWDHRDLKFTMQAPGLSHPEIINIEKKIRRLLPFEYKEFLLLFNGGHPEPCDFKNPAREQFDSVGLFHAVDSSILWDLIRNCNEYKGRIPSDLMSIADVGGNQICICTEGEHIGKIYLWDSEEEDPDVEIPGYSNVYLLADSLVEFLEELI